jgi:hypothetical protein
MTRLHLSNTLGSYPDREESKIPGVIVRVAIPREGGETSWLE